MATASTSHSRVGHPIPLAASVVAVAVTLPLSYLRRPRAGSLAASRLGRSLASRSVERLHIGGPRELPRRSLAAALGTRPANDGGDRLGARP
jgi:hypothetical protein